MAGISASYSTGPNTAGGVQLSLLPSLTDRARPESPRLTLGPSKLPYCIFGCDLSVSKRELMSSVSGVGLGLQFL